MSAMDYRKRGPFDIISPAMHILSDGDIEIGSDTIEPFGPNASREEEAQIFIHESTRVGPTVSWRSSIRMNDDAMIDESVE